jgi:hypothetical protein
LIRHVREGMQMRLSADAYIKLLLLPDLSSV